jgi:hypothetical protein
MLKKIFITSLFILFPFLVFAQTIDFERAPLTITQANDSSPVNPYKIRVNHVDNGDGTINITVGGGGTPGGNATEIQWNNTGSFDGIPNAAGYLKNDGAGVYTWDNPAGSGNVTANSTATEGNITVYGASNEEIKDSGIAITDVITTEVDPTVDTSAEIQAIIGSGIYANETTTTTMTNFYNKTDTLALPTLTNFYNKTETVALATLTNFYNKTDTLALPTLTNFFNKTDIVALDYATNTTLTTHTGNSTIHITAAERTDWDNNPHYIIYTIINTSGGAISPGWYSYARAMSNFTAGAWEVDSNGTVGNFSAVVKKVTYGAGAANYTEANYTNCSGTEPITLTGTSYNEDTSLGSFNTSFLAGERYGFNVTAATVPQATIIVRE